MSLAFMAEEPSVADRVFPVIPVEKQSDRYFIYDLADLNRVTMSPRAPGTESEGADWRLSSDTYYCDPYALHKDIAFEERQNADEPLDLDADTVAFLTRMLRLKKDKVWATGFFTTGIWTGSTTGSDITVGTKWDASNATPIEDLREQIRSVQTKTGYKPNKLVLGATTWDVLQDSAQFLDRIKYTQTGIVSQELLAKVLELDEVIVGETMEATSAEGAATTTTAQMFGEGALLLYVPKRPGRRTASAGYTFRQRVAGVPDQTIRKFEMTHLNSDRFEIQTCFDYKLTSALLGAFLSDVLT
jgi:hypothetical protein